ncbi:solute carrier family 43 member 3-like [Dendronephthya gigantea]|uniref:solute carrier family 43 member 3-like n=1 Tax=Dendronephthya gigantea TaxID=151771 RepID=UPI00106C87AE|nr:solute carrier family 43 member 3-like [Dendronephthya gigantea]
MPSQLKTNIRTVFGILEMVLFSGVIFGWANLVLVLKDEKLFRDLCEERDSNASTSITREKTDDKSDVCGAQDERLALIFTLGVFAFNVAGFIGGAMLDKLGTRVVRLIACFFFFLTGLFGFLLKKETANLMFPLIISLGFAGMFVAMPIFQIAILHRKHQSIVSSSLSGALDASSVVFLIFKTIYDSGVALRWVLMGYAIIAIVWISTTTLVLLPKTTISAELEEFSQETAVKPGLSKGLNAKPGVELGVSNQAMTSDPEVNQEMVIQSVASVREFDDINKQSAIENGKPVENTSTPAASTTPEEDKYASGWRYILTPRYLWFMFFFSLIQLRLWFFVGNLNGYLIYYTNDDKDTIERYSESFGLTQFFGFLIAPLTGIVMNLKPRDVNNIYYGPLISFGITLLLCITLGALVLIPVLEIQYFAFVVQVSMRAFLYAALISFTLRAFPVEHYGKLYGFITLVGAVISLLQYPAIVLIDGPSNGNPYWVNFGFLVATFTATGFPLYLWLSNRNVEETTTF